MMAKWWNRMKHHYKDMGGLLSVLMFSQILKECFQLNIVDYLCLPYFLVICIMFFLFSHFDWIVIDILRVRNMMTHITWSRWTVSSCLFSLPLIYLNEQNIEINILQQQQTKKQKTTELICHASAFFCDTKNVFYFCVTTWCALIR